MNTSEPIKRYDDPLFARMKKPEKVKAQERESDTGKKKFWIAAALILVAVAGYLFYAGWQRIEQLNTNLVQSRQQLGQVSDRLEHSNQQISGLQENLQSSQKELKSQNRQLKKYHTLYSDLKTKSEHLTSEQDNQSRNLEALTLQKADKSQVDTLKGETEKIQAQVQQANTNIADLRDATTSNRSDIDKTRVELNGVNSKLDNTSAQLGDLKQSLARDRFNFELKEHGGIMQVFNVSLSLKDTDYKKQRYEMEIFTDGKRIRKKNQAVDEPIYFYVRDSEKPYEIVVTSISNKFVTGYLSVPASANTKASP